MKKEKFNVVNLIFLILIVSLNYNGTGISSGLPFFHTRTDSLIGTHHVLGYLKHGLE